MDLTTIGPGYPSDGPSLWDIGTVDPHALLESWLADAFAKGNAHANAMTLATVGEGSLPHARVVLLKGLTPEGLTFFTHLDSPKVQQLRTNPHGAATFWWPETARQVRVEGLIREVSAAEADAQHRSRPRGHQLAAWVARQSSRLDSAQQLRSALELVAQEFSTGEVPRPPRWGGLRLFPHMYEFWQGAPDRLNERLRYVKSETGVWSREYLAP